MATNQRHCPFCGRWIARPHDWCPRDVCEDRAFRPIEAIIATAVVSTIVRNANGAGDQIRAVLQLVERTREALGV